jgi:hypothetical protein
MRRYRHFLRTGSGSNSIDLALDDTAGQLRITTLWMGEGQKQYKLGCELRSISDCFGLLVIQTIDAAIGEGASFESVALDPEEVLLPLVIEDLRVPKTPVYVHEESQLVMMPPAGYASWNEHFELVLLVHDFEWRAESSPLKEICGVLDKRKLEQHTEVEEQKRGSRRTKR